MVTVYDPFASKYMYNDYIFMGSSTLLFSVLLAFFVKGKMPLDELSLSFKSECHFGVAR